MIRGFTFERALGWAFTAPNVSTFPWIFGAVYAAVFMVALGIVCLLASGDVGQWIAMMESLEGTTDEEEIFAAMWAGFARLAPWVVLSSLLGWVIWAMFETASQRRYIFGEGFSLGFGMTELRMMVVGLLWFVMGAALMVGFMVPIIGAAFAAAQAGMEGMSDEEVGRRMIAPVFGAMGLMLITFPVYVFVATRLAPCFGLTVKENRIRFFDAWNVSRGRFWPIFGAYAILAIGGTIIGQVIVGIAQTIMMPVVMNIGSNLETGADIRALLLSPSFLIPMGIYLFIMFFVQGVMQHIVGGPAAFAVRNDPRGGIEAEAQVGAFT